MKLSNTEIFESYLSGGLSENSAAEFRQKLRNSKALRMSFHAYKSAFEALNEESRWNKINDLVDNLRDEIASEKEGYFEAYKNGELSGEEREIFEKDLKIDNLLNYEFEKFNKSKSAKVVEMPVIEGEAKIVSFRASTLYRVISIAAMFVLAIGAFWWVNQNGNQVNDQLYAAFYEAPETKFVKLDWDVRAPGSPIQNSEFLQLKDQAIQDFDAGNWHEAITGFESYVKNSEKTDDSYYLLVYSGVSYLELGLYDKAVETLTYSMENIKDEVNNSRRKETVQWYLALANLKNGNGERFEELVQPLTQATGKKVRENAKNILCQYNPENCKK